MSDTVHRQDLARRAVLGALAAFALLLGAVGGDTARAAAEDAGATASAWSGGDPAAVRLISATTATGGGEEVLLGLHFRMQPGWKIYWRSPGDAGFPPAPDWTGSDNLASARLEWPAPERFSILGYSTQGYGGEVVLPVVATPVDPGEPLRLTAKIPYLTCSDVCVPLEGEVALDLPAGAAAAADENWLIQRWRARVPDAGTAAGLRIAEAGLRDGEDGLALAVTLASDTPIEAPDLFVEGPDGLYGDAPREVEIDDGGRRARLVVPLVGYELSAEQVLGSELTLTARDGERALETGITVTPASGPGAGLDWSILLVALLGGLILNLMPCVLPVLSIKLLEVVNKGGAAPAHARAGFLAAASGIVVSFLVLAAALIALRETGAAIGWGIQFQQPWFLGAMAGIVTLFALNLLGVFEFALPGSLGDRAVRVGDGPGLGRHFATGVLATLLATPCSAPFVGTAVGFALSRGTGEILAIFAALGLGLAAPYLLIAAFPRLVTWLPRPGPWMVWLRRILALALLATAAWLLAVLWVQVSPLAVALCVAALVALATVLIARRRLPAALPLALVALLAAAVTPALIAPRGSPDGVVAVERDWRSFDRAAIATEVAAGNTVFVDVTAEWCITCQANKRLVIDTAEIAGLLARRDVVAMRADWTRPDPAIAAYLAEYGRYGIPFNIVYGPGAPEGVVLPELLSREAVRGALAEAGGAELRAALR